MKPDFSVGVIQGFEDSAINDSLFPCHSIIGGRMDWAIVVLAVKIKRANNLYCNL